MRRQVAILFMLAALNLGAYDCTKEQTVYFPSSGECLGCLIEYGFVEADAAVNWVGTVAIGDCITVPGTEAPYLVARWKDFPELGYTMAPDITKTNPEAECNAPS